MEVLIYMLFLVCDQIDFTTVLLMAYSSYNQTFLIRAALGWWVGYPDPIHPLWTHGITTTILGTANAFICLMGSTYIASIYSTSFWDIGHIHAMPGDASIYMQLCPHCGPLTLCIGVLWILRYMDLHYNHLNITSHVVSCKTNWLNSNMRSRLLYGVSCWNTLRVVLRTTLTHLCCFIWIKISVSLHGSPGFCFYH